MALYKKSDMIYNDYTWTASPGDNPKITGKVDRDKLAKKEGYEVLDFINQIASVSNFTSIAPCQKIEKMLRDNAIKDVHSREKILKWLVDNWQKY